MRDKPPKWSYWLNRDDWSVWEASNLIAGREPPTGFISLDLEPRPTSPLDRVVEEIRELAMSSIRQGNLEVEEHIRDDIFKKKEYFTTREIWTHWANRKNLPLPDEMHALPAEEKSRTKTSGIHDEESDPTLKTTSDEDGPPNPQNTIEHWRLSGKNPSKYEESRLWCVRVAWLLWHKHGVDWSLDKMAEALHGETGEGIHQLCENIPSLLDDVPGIEDAEIHGVQSTIQKWIQPYNPWKGLPGARTSRQRE